MEDIPEAFEYISVGQDGRNIEFLLKKIVHNQEHQDDQINNIQTAFSMQMNALKRSFKDIEDRVCNRLDQEKELQRNNLAGAMKLILAKLPQIPNIMQASQASDQSQTDTKVVDSLSTSLIPVKPPLDDLLPPYSSKPENIRADDAVNVFKSETMLNSLSIQVTSGFDRLREDTIRELEHDKQLLEQDKQQLEYDKQQLTKDKAFIQDQLYKTLSDVIVRVDGIHTCIAQLGNSPNSSPDSKAAKIDDLRQEANLSADEIKKEFGNMKGALLREFGSVYLDEMKTVVIESFGEMLNKTTGDTSDVIQKCFGQQLETMTNEFHDEFETTRNELVRIVSNNQAEHREQNNPTTTSVTSDELRQELAAVRKHIDINRDTFCRGLDESVASFKAEITDAKTELESCVGEQSQHQNEGMRKMVDELKGNIKQIMTYVGEKTNTLQPPADFGKIMDNVGKLMKKTVNDMHGTHQHEVRNVQEEVQSLREDIVVLETRPNVDISNEEVKLMLAEINEQVHVIPYGDLTKRINAIRTDVKDVVKVSRDSLNKELTKIRKQIIQEVHRDMDKRMQSFGRDITDVIEKEAQLSRESIRSFDVDQRKDFEFHFRIQEFEKRVQTGIKMYGCPWHIPQFDSCIRCYVCFLKDGTMYIKLIDGRYPKVVGLRPKPVKPFSFKMTLVGCERSSKTKILKDTEEGKFDEAKQITRTGSWGYDVGVYNCDQLRKEGFVEEDEMLIKCFVTVL